MSTTDIGQRIKSRREDLGLTPFELAIKSGVQEQNIRNWESGRRVMSTEFLVPLARALGVTPNELLGYEAGQQACACGRA